MEATKEIKITIPGNGSIESNIRIFHGVSTEAPFFFCWRNSRNLLHLKYFAGTVAVSANPLTANHKTLHTLIRKQDTKLVSAIFFIP